MSEPNVKYKIAWPDLEECAMSVNLSLKVKEWRGFLQHCEKTGSPIARKIADTVTEAIAEVDRRKKDKPGAE